MPSEIENTEEQSRDDDRYPWYVPALACIQFFTRLPVHRLRAFDPPPLGLTARYFPVAGLLVGVIAALVFRLADLLALPGAVSVLLALVAMTLVTGALHEDGLADTADGIGGGSSRERRLEIMTDSRIGAYGVLALILATGLKLAALLSLSAGAVTTAFLLAAILSRGLLPLFMFALPPAKPGGLAAQSGETQFGQMLFALAASLAFLWIGLGLLDAVFVGIVLAAVSITFAVWLRNTLGGVTGDALGALQQVLEVTVYIAIAALSI